MKSHAGRVALASTLGLVFALLAPLGAQAAETPSLDQQIAATDASSVIDSAANESVALSVSERLLASDDPAAVFSSLTTAEQSAFKAYAVVDRVETKTEYTPADAVARESASVGLLPDETYAPQATGCWVATTYTYGKNVLGNDLWRVQLNGGWCSSGSSVYSSWLDGSWGQTYWIGWTHQGRVGSGSGIVSNQGRTWVQHKFTYGTGGWDIQTQLPCLRVKGASSGSATSDLVCGLY